MHHLGISHNTVLLGIFLFVIVLMGVSAFKVTNPSPAQPTEPDKTPRVIVTNKGALTEYTDTNNGFRFSYPSELSVNDRGFKFDAINLIYLPIANAQGKLGSDFPPDQYGALAKAIRSGTKFQPIKSAENTKGYPLKNDFETLKIGERYFVRDFAIYNRNCECIQVQYVTVLDNAFLSFSMVTTTTPEYKLLLLSDKSALMKKAFPALEASLTSLTTF